MTSAEVKRLVEHYRTEATSFSRKIESTQVELAKALVVREGMMIREHRAALAEFRAAMVECEDAAAGLERLALEIENVDFGASLC